MFAYERKRKDVLVYNDVTIEQVIEKFNVTQKIVDSYIDKRVYKKKYYFSSTSLTLEELGKVFSLI